MNVGNNQIQKILKEINEEKIKNFSFNESLAKIKELTEFFEEKKEDIDIELGLEVYEKTIKLIAHCKGKLDEVKSKKEKIDQKYSDVLKNNY